MGPRLRLVNRVAIESVVAVVAAAAEELARLAFKGAFSRADFKAARCSAAAGVLCFAFASALRRWVYLEGELQGADSALGARGAIVGGVCWFGRRRMGSLAGELDAVKCLYAVNE